MKKIWKKPGSVAIFTCSVIKFRFDSKNLSYKQKVFVIIKNFIFIKQLIQVALQYLFNVFIIFNTASFLKLNFKLKIDQKMYTFNNLEEIFPKTSGNPDCHNLIN